MNSGHLARRIATAIGITFVVAALLYLLFRVFFFEL
jgi:hypothetical protein